MLTISTIAVYVKEIWEEWRFKNSRSYLIYPLIFCLFIYENKFNKNSVKTHNYRSYRFIQKKKNTSVPHHVGTNFKMWVNTANQDH